MANPTSKKILYTYVDSSNYTITFYSDGSVATSETAPNETVTQISGQTYTISSNADATYVAGNSTQRINIQNSYDTVVFTNNSGDIIDGHSATGKNALIGSNGKDTL